MAKEFVTFEEAMALLQVEDSELRELVSSGELRAFRDQNRLRFRQNDVLALKRKREMTPTIITDGTGGEGEISIEDTEDAPTASVPIEEKKFVTFDEALADLQTVGIDENRLMELVANGQLRAVRMEGKVQLRSEEVARLKAEFSGAELPEVAPAPVAPPVVEKKPKAPPTPAEPEPMIEIESPAGDLDESAPTVVPTIELSTDSESVDETAATVVPTVEEVDSDRAPTIEAPKPEEEEEPRLLKTGQIKADETSETAVPTIEISPVDETSETVVPVAEAPAEEVDTQVAGQEIGLAEEQTASAGTTAAQEQEQETSGVTMAEEPAAPAVPEAPAPREIVYVEEESSPLVTALLGVSLVILLVPTLGLLYGAVVGHTPEFLSGFVQFIQSKLGLS